jgi:hypothetical protein
MTPEERQLITGLFDRMRDFGSPEKDREAEALINQSVRANPDAAYMLVQSVLVQGQALQAANDRVMELEDRLRAAEEGAPVRAPAAGGSFLGGLFGSGRAASEPEPRSGSVPSIGTRATPSVYGDRASWSRASAQPPAPEARQQAAGGGSFMRTALATATGVAGGMLLAESIRNMMETAHAGQSPSAEGGTRGAEQQQQDYIDAKDNDPGNYNPDDGMDIGDLDI